MRFDTGRFFSGALFAAMLAAGLAVPVSAMAGQVKERIYGDSFGNLVVYSPAGYKSIVVGRGYIADELAAAEAAQEPAPDRRGKPYLHRCYYKPMFWRGRDRMYGLPDGVVPTPPRICR